jgi:dienelactone hydrolase
METKLVKFYSTDGLELNGALFTPEKSTQKIIIYVHGSGGNFYGNSFIKSLAEKSVANGFAFLSFDNRGAGAMMKFKKQGENTSLMIGNELEVFEDCIHDIQGAVDFTQEVGYKEIVLVGHSLGCNKILQYALESGFGGRLVLLAPVDMVEISLVRKLTRKTPWEADTEIDMLRYRDGKVVERVSSVKNDVLVQVGTLDECIYQPDKTDCVEYLKKVFPNLSADLIDGADHHYSGYENVLADNVIKWVAK